VSAGLKIRLEPLRGSLLIALAIAASLGDHTNWHRDSLRVGLERSRDRQGVVAIANCCPGLTNATGCLGMPPLPDGRGSVPGRGSDPDRGSVPGRDSETLAYIGPGAGFAFLGSFLTLVAGFFLTLFSLLLWPFRVVWRLLKRRRGYRKAQVKKTIFLGLDGLDPKLTERFIAEGKLPNLARLAAEGSYRRLRTTYPSLSPVAWSTFATGVSPAKHNIFDFLDRDLKSYLPRLSSARVGKPDRVLRIGRWRIPLSSPTLELRQKSRPFWKILGEQGVGCTIIRVPITFPPEQFDGKLLSAMCTPDLKGTQGSFSQFTTRVEKATYENGSRYPLRAILKGYEGEIEGPEDTFIEDGKPLRIPFRILRENAQYELRVQDHQVRLDPGTYTDWLRLSFRTAIGAKAIGIARFLLTETEPECSLYMSPINIDPSRPALPISHPSCYAVYLANLLGSYATAGMAEDTWALNEGVIDEDAFLRQAYSIYEEREAMFLNALESTARGVVACVFDTSDRVQHMFYANMSGSDRHAKVIEEMYQRMDTLVGKTLPFVDADTALFVLSDHGFCAFRRGVNLNSWLRDNGYLHLKEHARVSEPFFEGVDWSRTRAYALGLGGFYLNIKGREALGIVEPGQEAERLKQEIIVGLSALREETGESPIRTVYATASLYRGPYLEAAPDFLVGYNEGYRASWEGAVGKVSESVLEDNEKAWSGDHCVDPVLVPGVLFSNRQIQAEDPGIEDLAPTALRLFGVDAPAWMDGTAVL
jgi:predicted AlkP superfamily phosphohydrolase/phosphomutase